MGLGVHFVSRDENALGFAVWQVSAAAQDAVDYAGESEAAANALKDESWHFIGVGEVEHVVLHSEATEQEQIKVEAGRAREAQDVASQAVALLRQAQKIAEGKRPDDAEAIAAVNRLWEKAKQLAEAAKAGADSTSGDYESRFR